MKFSYNWLSEYLKKKLSPQQMVELLTMHAFEVEGLDKFGNDWVLDIKVLPNRAHDCLSHIGIAKELATLSGTAFVLPKFKFTEDKKIKVKDYISVEVPAKDLCSRYSMRVATNVKIRPSPKWIQEYLLACGLRPISNIVDITNYVMLETGQPLHAFDVEKLTPAVIASEAKQSRVIQPSSDGIATSPSTFYEKCWTPRNDEIGKIIVRRANKDEQITTLEGKTYKLSPQNLVIADAKVAIGIAGIKGGKGPEIDENTKVVAVESANFEPTNIRRTSKTFNLKTDASMRFENGLDPELTKTALERSISLIAEIAGGKVAAGLVDVYPNKVKPRKVFMDVLWAQGLIGLAVRPQEMVNILKKLEIPSKIIKRNKKIFIEAIAPTSRLDLQAQEDLVEEIVRILGYDKVPAQTPSGILIPAVKEDSLVYEDKIKDILFGAGWSEAQNYSFISDEDVKNFDIFKKVEIRNPLSNDQKYLRPTLVVNLLKNAKENLKHFDSVRLFEAGHIFSMVGTTPTELHPKVAAVVVNKNSKNPAEGLFELKGLIHILFEKLGIGDVWFDDAISADFPVYWFTFTHPSRRAQVKCGDRQVGWIGEIKPKTLNGMEIKEKISVFELDLTELADLASEEREYQPPSKYPAVIRDVAVLVEPITKVEEVLNVIETVGGKLVSDVDLFDIYEGEGIPENKKNLAFHIIYQSNERTLTNAEVNRLQEKIIKALEEKEWEVRK